MDIRQLAIGEAPPMELLLEADPSESMVRSYLSEGVCYLAELDGSLIGVYVLVPLSQSAAEIKNIAVVPSVRGQGLGKELVLHALAEAKRSGYGTVEIGTGNSSLNQLALYQKCGFRLHSIDRDFFTRHYLEPIIENGIVCRDMIRLIYHVD